MVAGPLWLPKSLDDFKINKIRQGFVTLIEELDGSNPVQLLDPLRATRRLKQPRVRAVLLDPWKSVSDLYLLAHYCTRWARWSFNWCGAPERSRCLIALLEQHHYLRYEQPFGGAPEVSGLGAIATAGMSGLVECDYFVVQRPSATKISSAGGRAGRKFMRLSG